MPLIGRRVGDGIFVAVAGALACATAMAPPGPGSPVRAVLAVVAVALGVVPLLVLALMGRRTA